MAKSPAHRLGQIIGDVLEAAILPELGDFAARHRLYLDKKGRRPCRSGIKCAWKDLNGNSHDLDFVLERAGTPQHQGVPVAFIETAWRRYTKHSRNKAQEIQGAIVPLAETHKNAGPFKGAILAGVFTQGALTQLRSLGFTVLYFPYETVVAVFLKFGIDVAFDEDTSEPELKKKIRAYEKLSPDQRADLSKTLLTANSSELGAFVASLEAAVARRIKRILILPLYGSACEVANVEDAVKFVERYQAKSKSMLFVRYEIQIAYNNGDEIKAEFGEKTTAIKFLRSFLPVAI
ncbi:MAG TPA: hypothetical protein VNF29_06670 [Candidatus Binataceae bacterium]|nr:hypothetical protein [Candidatus Binataceae bacterium]